MNALPHNPDAERAVLGAMLLSREAVAVASEIITNGNAFYTPAHGLLWDTITTMAADGTAVDPITVAHALGERVVEIGGPAQLVVLQTDAGAPSSLRRHAELVMDCATARAYGNAGREISALFSSAPTDMDWARARASELFSRAESLTADESTLVGIGAAADDVLTELLDRLDGKLPDTAISTGISDLDAILGPLEPGTLILVGGRPGMGKTVIGCHLARHVALRLGKPVAFASLEMPRRQIAERILAGEGRISARRLRERLLTDAEWDRLPGIVSSLQAAPLEILDSAQVSVGTLRAAARQTRRRHGSLALFIVDYVQLMIGAGDAESRRVEIDRISRALKVLAREEGCVVVALAQLNRNVDSRSDKRPLLGDLRESGALEADADMVLYPYRDEVYHRDTPEPGIVELIVAKNRHGSTGVAKAAWLGNFQTVSPMPSQQIGGAA